MYKQRGGITGQPIHISALRAALVFFLSALLTLGAGIAGLIEPTLPGLALRWVNIALICVGSTSLLLAVRFWLLYRQIHLEFSWLSKSRFYTFQDGRTPYLDSQRLPVVPWAWKEPLYVSRLIAPVGKLFSRLDGVRTSSEEPLHSARWTVEWPRYLTAKQELPHPTDPEQKIPVFKKTFIACPENAVFAKRAAWLRTTHHERHDLVLLWWRTAFKMKGDPATGGDHYVEYLIGANVACEPTWWSKKLGHGVDFEPVVILQAQLRKLPATRHTNIDAPPTLPTAPVPTDFYAGKGFQWQNSHLQRMLWHQSFDASEAGKSPDQGDGRWYAVGVKDEKLNFISRSTTKQHLGIIGATGVGKTRLFQQTLEQLVRSGDRVVIIDPKGDEELLDHIVSVGRESGRAHQLRIFNLVLPNNRNYCTMNVMDHFDQAESLGNRTGCVIDDSSDPYWKGKAIQVSRDVYSAVVACREFLRFLGRDRKTGEIPHHQSTSVPLVLLAIQWAATHPGCTPQQAEEGVRAILKKQESDQAWRPTSADEVAVTKLAAMNEYTPAFWCPTIMHVSQYAINQTALFLALLVKVTQFHAFMEVSPSSRPAGAAPGRSAPPPPSAIPSFSAPDFALTAPVEAITGKASGGAKPPPMYLMQIYREAGLHPLELRLLTNRMPLNQAQEKWRAFYDYFIPAPPADGEHDQERARQSDALGSSLSRLKNQVATIASFAELDRSDFLQQVSTLQSGLARFMGPKERIISAPIPDISWGDMISERHIVYCNLGSLIDKDAATGLAKMILSNLMSYAGEIYHFHQNAGKELPAWYIFGDEFGRWGNLDSVEMAATGRGAGVNFIVGTQTRADFVSALGSESAAQQFEGNINTVYQMRAAHRNDAEAFANRCGKIPVTTKNLSNRLTSDLMGGGNRNIDLFSGDLTVSLNVEQKELVPPEFSMQLPIGQVLCSVLGGETFLLSIGRFPKTDVSIKQEYGTLTDTYDENAGKQIAKEMDRQVAAAAEAHQKGAPPPLVVLPAAPTVLAPGVPAPPPTSPTATVPTPAAPPPFMAPPPFAPAAPGPVPAPPAVLPHEEVQRPATVHPVPAPMPAPTSAPVFTAPPPFKPAPIAAAPDTQPAPTPAPVPLATPPATAPVPQPQTPPVPPARRSSVLGMKLVIPGKSGAAPATSAPEPDAAATTPESPTPSTGTAPESTVGLPAGSPGSVHLPQVPTAKPNRGESIGGGSPFALDD